MAADFVGVNSNGIRQTLSQRNRSGGRRCLVTWKKLTGGGVKIKRTFKSKAHADAAIALYDPRMVSYRCKLHRGWHIGHVKKRKV